MAAPYAAMVPRGTYNAKTLPLGQSPYLAADNYGVTPDNAAKQFQRIYADRATVDGGSKAIYDKLVKWSSPEELKARGQNPNSQQWQLMRQAVTTGKVDPRLNPELLQQGLGLGLTETARAQQHKPQSFLSKFGGSLLTAGLAFVPVAGPYLAAASGGYFGQKNGGGVLGGLLGAAGGYLGGRSVINAGGASGIYNSAKEGLSNLIGRGGFTNPASLGLSGGNLALGGLSNAPAATAVGGYGAGALGYTGSNLGLNLASGFGAAPHVGQGVSAIVKPEDIYKPVSMGGTPGPTAVDRALTRGAKAIAVDKGKDILKGVIPSDEVGMALGGLGFLPQQNYDTSGGKYIAPIGRARSRRLARVLAAKT